MFAEQGSLTKLKERVVAISSNHCDDEDTYCKCRNTVCELAVARAASMRTKEDEVLAETRSDVIRRVWPSSRSWSGGISSRLVVILDQMS